MKLSTFNLILPTKIKGEYLLANMMSGAVIAIDEEMKTIIEKEDVHSLTSNERGDLLQHLGILLPDSADEYKKFKVRYEKKKYTVDSPNFTLIPTYACNLACPYCYEGKGELLKGTMNRDTRKRAAKFIKHNVEKYNAKKFSIALYGGEPLLNFDDCAYIMDSCFQWADDQGIEYRTHIISNGTLITPDIAEKLQQYKTRAIQLTLDGPQRIHDKKRIYKNGNGTFDDIIKAANILQDHNVSIHFRINVDKENRLYLGELLDELASLKLNSIPTVCAPIGEFQACTHPECIHEKEVNSIIAESRELLKEKGQSTPPIKTHKSSQVFCSFLREGNYIIDPYAHVYKCLTFVGLKEHCIGHIDNVGRFTPTNVYYDWMSRDPLTIKECKQCKMLPACGGGCASVAYERHKTYHACGCYDPHSETKDQLKWFLETNFPQHFKDGKIIWS